MSNIHKKAKLND